MGYTVGAILKGRFVTSLETVNRGKAFEHGKKIASLGVTGIITENHPDRPKTYHVRLRPTKGFFIERV